MPAATAWTRNRPQLHTIRRRQVKLATAIDQERGDFGVAPIAS
jgi:hypothetical protein